MSAAAGPEPTGSEPRNLEGIRIEKLKETAVPPEKGWDGKTAVKFEK